MPCAPQGVKGPDDDDDDDDDEWGLLHVNSPMAERTSFLNFIIGTCGLITYG
jgi:hypothetical protein